jgi:hypothetical protein
MVWISGICVLAAALGSSPQTAVLSATVKVGGNLRRQSFGRISGTVVGGKHLASVCGAEAKGCIKGAVVGGVAGHMAGHGKLGAAAGCVIGHHEANKPDPNNANAQAPTQK